MKCHHVLVAAIAIGAFAPLPAQAGTIDKIRASKEIAVGYRLSAVPFSYSIGDQKPIGYSVEICEAIVSTLKDQLSIPDLRTKFVAVESSSRIPLVSNGTVDIECGTTSNTAERQSQVAFSLTTFVAGTKFASRKADKLDALSDLKGKTVAATAGSSNSRQITELNRTRNLELRIVPAKDFGEGFLMLETGRIAAFFLDDVSLAALIAGSKAPSAYKLSDESFSVEPYAIMMRKDDPAFKEAVDRALRAFLTSPKSKEIYSKWFERPVPPKGTNLELPISDKIKKAFEQPTDSPDPGSY